jgi:Protein of unknown function (DUF3313)
VKAHVKSIALKATVVFLMLPFNRLSLWSQTSPMTGADSANTPVTTNWKTTKRGSQTIRVNPDANLSLYNTISVGNVAYTGQANKLKPQESDKLVLLLHDTLITDLAATKLSRDIAAAGALTLNANITRVKRSHPWINVVTMAAVFVPLDLGAANVTAWIVDQRTGQVVAEIETGGCGQIYQVLQSLQPFGQSKLVLRKESRSISKEVNRMNWNQQQAKLNIVADASKE